MSAHEYSKLATLLDIGAVGGVALERVLESEVTSAELWRRLLIGAVSESLMVWASRQYVQAFRAEITSVYQTAAWHLYDELWRISEQAQPEQEPATRRQAIDQLLAPIHDQKLEDTVKAVLIGRIFQILLLIHLGEATYLKNEDVP